MQKNHHVIYVPGLSDQNLGYEFLLHSWRLYGIMPHIHRIGWHDNAISFTLKLKRLVSHVNEYLQEGSVVSLVGGSAGGSAVLNALLAQPRINAVVNLCGRLRTGENVYPSLNLAAKRSATFKDSILLFERSEPAMDRKLRSKVLSLIPIWDQIVPKSTAYLRGATNQTLLSVEHMTSGFLGMTVFSPILMNFIKKRRTSLYTYTPNDQNQAI